MPNDGPPRCAKQEVLGAKIPNGLECSIPHLRIEMWGTRHPAPGNSVRAMENLGRILYDLIKVSNPLLVWLTPAFTAIVGAVVGLFAGFFKDLIVSNFVGKRTMQSALYRDIAEMFFAIDRIMNVEESLIGSGHPDKLVWRQEQIRQSRFMGEEYYSGNPAIYMQLPERFAVQTLYRKLQYVLDQPPTSLPFNTQDLAKTIAFFVEIGVLKRKYFKKYCKKNGRVFLRIVDEVNRQRKNRIQCLIEETEAQRNQEDPVS